jgi:hypothetical protein
MDTPAFDLSTHSGFVDAIRFCRGEGTVDGLHCPHCGGRRRVKVEPLTQAGDVYRDGDVRFARTVSVGAKAPLIVPKPVPASSDPPRGPLPISVYRLSCVQCDAAFTAVIYAGPVGADVAILASVHGGLRTPNTPEPVAYYLDEAARCESVGARSAAVSMYRAALEQLLHQQGFTKGMLNHKIEALEAAEKAGNAPSWSKEIEPGLLKVIKDLGNAAIHPNGGDITKQDALDGALLVSIRVAFELLLEKAYEAVARARVILAKLEAGKSKTDVASK